MGDGGLGPTPNPQSPIPNPQSPKQKFLIITKKNSIKKNIIGNSEKIYKIIKVIMTKIIL